MSSGSSVFEGLPSTSTDGFTSSGRSLHIEGMAGTSNSVPSPVSPLFVRGSPILKILHDSAFAPPQKKLRTLENSPLRLSDYVH